MPSKLQKDDSEKNGRVGSRSGPKIQATQSSFLRNPETARQGKGKLVATAVLCRFGINPRIQENERESKNQR